LTDGDFYIPGESLEAYISNTGNYYLLEVTTDGFSSYQSCTVASNGYSRVDSYTEGASGANGLTITAPSSGDLVLKAVWASGYGQTVNLREITLTSSPTPSPTPEPTPEPTANPTLKPTASPTMTYSPTSGTSGPTVLPSFKPTSLPTSLPIPAPSSVPILNPTPMPTLVPTPHPTSSPVVTEETDDGSVSDSVSQAPISAATATFMTLGLFFLVIGPILAVLKYKAAAHAFEAAALDSVQGVDDGGDLTRIYSNNPSFSDGSNM
jgi:hypothetical protein